MGKALVLKLKTFAVGLAALFVSGCGYVAAMRTPVVVKENCQAAPEASEFLSKFALNPAAVVVLKEPTPLQYANNSLATIKDQQAIALLAQTREQCFAKLEEVNPDPQGRLLYNGTNLVMAHLYNREITFGRANEMASALQQELVGEAQKRVAADRARWANVAALGSAIYLNSLQSQVQASRPTVLSCSGFRTGAMQTAQCVAQ